MIERYNIAMNNSNYDYSPSGFSSPSPYSSTPSGIRTQRPRFGYSGPTLYPRPRSSASKPNPDSFSDSMINNYGTSASRIDTSFNSENGDSCNDSYLSSNSNYYTANESFYSQNQSCGEASMIPDSSMMYDNLNMMSGNMRGDRSLARGGMQNSGMLSKPSEFVSPQNIYNSDVNDTGENKANFQKNSTLGFGERNNRPPYTRKFNTAKRMSTKTTARKCVLCNLDFTSQIPYDMHLRGAKHAKKLKAKEALSAVQSQAIKGPDDDKTFFCELCNVRANSSLQLQTHLAGSKHKNKLQPKEPKEQSQEASKETTKTETEAPVNEKTNGSLTRPLPADFGEPQPSKLAKFACDVCCISVNSEIQLQQHLTSKKHQNKVEGKPVIKGKKNKKENKTASETHVMDVVMADTECELASNEASTKVVGVKTLASSFVQGETLQ